MKKIELKKQIKKLELRVTSYKEKAAAVNEQLLISERQLVNLLRENEQLRNVIQERENLANEVALFEVKIR